MSKDFLLNTYKYFDNEPHQIKAIEFLSKYLDDDLLTEFTSIWRSSISIKPVDPLQLTKNFHLDELIKSNSAKRYGINNTPDPDSISNLRALAFNILQPVRDHFGKPVIVSSGYRSPILNKKIGGSSTSQHTKGEAADFEIPGIPNYDVAKWIAQNLSFDQLILEYYTTGIPNSGWIHCSYKRLGNNRKQTLQYSGRKYTTITF